MQELPVASLSFAFPLFFARPTKNFFSRAQQIIFSRFPLPPLKATGDEAGTILSWGAKGLAFLAKNLWIVAILIAGAIYKYLQNRRKK
jgi:hypothetical protein